MRSTVSDFAALGAANAAAAPKLRIRATAKICTEANAAPRINWRLGFAGRAPTAARPNDAYPGLQSAERFFQLPKAIEPPKCHANMMHEGRDVSRAKFCGHHLSRKFLKVKCAGGRRFQRV